MAATGWQEKLAWPKLVVFMIVVFLLMTTVGSLTARKKAFNLPDNNSKLNNEKPEDVKIDTWCPVPEPTAAQDGLADSSTQFGGDEQLRKQVDRLTKVVDIPTISYDDNGDVGEDPRWQAFVNLHDTLKTLFPKVHERLDLEKINSYGLLYTLPGSSQTLKPVVIMAHQDVVPVPDPTRWKYPPFEAYFDGEWLWGRGSVDCRSNLIGILSAMERLLEQDFNNKRTIILSFGFDEETGGFRGAKYLAAHLQEKYGENGVAMIIDEGGSGIRTIDGVGYAFPAVIEKGFLDIVLTLDTPGGHSSSPPSNSGIGIMSRLLAALEDHPLPPHLDAHNPILNYLKCETEYSPKATEPWLREALEKNEDITSRILESRGDKIRWSLQTSQSLVIINGGIKDNQLPETVQAVINYRILPSETPDTILKSVTDVLAPLANNLTIAVTGAGYSQIDRGSGILNITTINTLPSSPLSPTDLTSGPWTVLSSTIRQVFENAETKSFEANKIIPVGSLASSNTDTAHYWGVSRNIYRFSPRWEGAGEGVHTVDERMDMAAHLMGVRFYYEVFRNMDGYEGE